MNCSYRTRSCAECWSMRTSASSRSNSSQVSRTGGAAARGMLRRREAGGARPSAAVARPRRASNSGVSGTGAEPAARRHPSGAGLEQRRRGCAQGENRTPPRSPPCRAHDAPRARPRVPCSIGRESAPRPWPGARSRPRRRPEASPKGTAMAGFRPESVERYAASAARTRPGSRTARPLTVSSRRRLERPTSAGRWTRPLTRTGPLTSSTATSASAASTPHSAATRSRNDAAGASADASRPSCVTAMRTSGRASAIAVITSDDRAPLAARAAKEFLARRRVVEQVGDRDRGAAAPRGGARSGRACRRRRARACPRRRPWPSRSRTARHRADRGERLAAKAEAPDADQVAGVADLRRRMAVEGEHGVLARHADAVVAHADESAAALGRLSTSTRVAAGVERVLDELLDHRRRPLDDLAGGDLVGDGGRQDRRCGARRLRSSLMKRTSRANYRRRASSVDRAPAG